MCYFTNYGNSSWYSFLPLARKIFNITIGKGKTSGTAKLNFLSAAPPDSKLIYFEGITEKKQNLFFWCYYTKNTNEQILPTLLNYTYDLNIIRTNYKSDMDQVTITSPFYILRTEEEYKINIDQYEANIPFFADDDGQSPDHSLVLSEGFRMGNIEVNNTGKNIFIKNADVGKQVAQLKLQNDDIAETYLKDNFYSLSSGNPWTVEGNNDNVNFTFVSKGNYTAVINGKTYTFTFDGNGWNVDSGKVTVTNTSLTLSNGSGVTLNSAKNLLYTTLFYFYGTDPANQAAPETPFYYYPLMVLSNPPPTNSSISFLELPGYNISSVNIIPSNVPPSNTDEFTYLDLNVASGIADVNFEYVLYEGNNYFIRNLSRSSNLGSYQNPNPNPNLKLFLFNNGLLSDNLNDEPPNKAPQLRLRLESDSSYPGIIELETKNNIVPESNKSILQVIRRNSPFFENFNQDYDNPNYKERKIKQYLDMISKQNNGFTQTITSVDKFQLIILPQKTVTVSADYSVFKSPYSIEEDGSYKFLCYNDNGTPKAKGTRITLGRNQKMYFNKACNDYNTEEDPTCGVIGISASGGGTSLIPCQQVRINQTPNFLDNCLPYTQDKYNTVGNLFESGVVLQEMFKAKEMSGKIDDKVNVFKDFFTREEETGKVYKPDQELYTNKNQQNFYLSLKDDNTDFVVKPSSWERVFTYQNLTKSVVYQNHLDTENQITISTPINFGLTNNPEENKISGNLGYRMVFKNSKTGINTQNFLYTGVQFYYDTNNGADYNFYNSFFLQQIGQDTDGNIIEPLSYFLNDAGRVSSGKVVINKLIGDNRVWTVNTLGPRLLPNEGLEGSQPLGGGRGYGFQIFDTGYKLISRKRILNSLNSNTVTRYDLWLAVQVYNYPSMTRPTTSFLNAYNYSFPVNVDNINNYVAYAELVKVAQENKIENLIKFTIIDNNLTNEYSNVTDGDYINIDENFFGQLFFNLLGNGSKISQIKLGKYPDSSNSDDNPQLISPFQLIVEGSRVLHIYGDLSDFIDIDYVNKTILKSLQNNGVCKFVSGDFQTDTVSKISNINDFVGQTNIEVFDILVFYKIYNSENPYFAKVIKIETEKDTKGIITSYTLTFQKDIKGTLSENNNNLTGNGVFFNLKKTGSVIDNYYKIIERDGSNVSFYFSIGEYTITSFSGDTNYVYDSRKVNTNSDGYKYVGRVEYNVYDNGQLKRGENGMVVTSTGPFQNFHQTVTIWTSGTISFQHHIKQEPSPPTLIQNPLNTFSYFISARYIKSKAQIPYYTITENKLYASMTRKNGSDYYDTKLLSYVTQYTKQDSNGQTYYYFKEFREDYGYDNPQVDKCFAVHDVIRYITKKGTADNYTEEKVADFRVVKIDAIVENTYENMYIFEGNDFVPGNPTKIYTRYDYKCVLVKEYNLDNTGNISKNQVSTYTSFPNLQTYDTYGGFTSYAKDTTYQLPYIGWSSGFETATFVGEKDPYQVAHVEYNIFFVLGKTEEGNIYAFQFFPKFTGQPNGDNKSFQPPIYIEIKTKNVGAAWFQFSDIELFDDYHKFVYAKIDDKYSEPGLGYTQRPATVAKLQTDYKYSSEFTYPTKYIRGNRLDVLRLVSTTLKSDRNPSTDYINIEITELTGKAYGSEIVLNATNSENLTPNYNRIGNITQFVATSLQIDNSEIGDIFESNKGFQLILTDEAPSEYEFVSMEKNSKIAPYETESDQIISPYNKDDIVSIIDRNVRQYFRNNTVEDSPFNFKLQQTSNFEIVPKTVYPEDAFIDFHPNTFYEKGEVVRFSSDTELSGLYKCDTSNLNQPIQTANHFWTYDILTKNMESNHQQFYSFVYPGTTITKGDDLNEIITKTKELNNLNLPLEIKNFDDEGNETDYCPNYCGVGNGNKTLKQIIDESFVGKLDYFDNIKYLFENPVLVKKENNKKYLSLGNTPVSYNEKGDYSVTFLSSSNDERNLVSQFLYFLDLDNDRKIYNKPKCNQNFVHYKSDGTSINSGVSNFEFSNSLVFQFFPCDLGSQDYISYGVSENNVVTLNDTKNILWNRFPPVNGLTKSGGVSIPLIVQDGDNFSGVSQTFETTYLTSNIISTKLTAPQLRTTISLTHSSGDTVNLIINETGNTLEGVGVSEAISNNGTCYSYGDVWHLTPKGGTSILTYGFVVPEENGKLTDKSFIQIKDFNNNVEDCSIFINSNTGSGFCMSGVSGFNCIRDYTITSVSGTTDGIYTGKFASGTVSANIKFDSSGNVLQRNQAVASPAVTSGTSIFVPSHNVKENIKVKALATFGSNYLANIKYNNLGFRTLENKISPTGIFDIYSNSIFSNQISGHSTNVLIKNKNLLMSGLLDVMKIKFTEDNFDIQLNNFSLPINNDKSNLIQRKGINLGAINSNSINEFTVEEIKSVIGVSVGVDFKQFTDFNLDYDPSNNKIPGNTNTQIQIREIRQNTSSDYIDPKNNCSLYFEPELLPTTKLDGDSIFLKNSNNSNQGGDITVTVNTLQNLYQFTSSQNQRFRLDFDTDIEYNTKASINFYLGNNLTYHIDQTDKSNIEYPLVFSTSGTDFKNNIVNRNEESFGGGTILVNYFLDFKEVSYSEYINLNNFNNATQDRSIRFKFQTPFSDTSVNVSLFYGFNKDNGQRHGGKFNVIYH
jgi:hypothetical protein